MFLSAVYFHEMHKYLRDYKMFKIMSLNIELHKCKNNSIIKYRNVVFFNLNSIYKYQDNFTNIYVLIDYEKIYLKFCTLYGRSIIPKKGNIPKEKYIPIIPKYVKGVLLYNTNRLEYFKYTLKYYNNYNIFYNGNKVCNISSWKLNKLIDKKISNYILYKGNNSNEINEFNSYVVNGEYLLDIALNDYDSVFNDVNDSYYHNHDDDEDDEYLGRYCGKNFIRLYFRFTKFLDDIFNLNESINCVLINNDFNFRKFRIDGEIKYNYKEYVFHLRYDTNLSIYDNVSKLNIENDYPDSYMFKFGKKKIKY